MNYLFAIKIEKVQSVKILTVAVVANLLNLSAFKYFDFFVHSVTDFFNIVGLGVDVPKFNYWLPLGISFYTFQMVAYLVDVYRKDIRAERNILTFAVFTSFYAQLVAGPIVRAGDLLPQIKEKKYFNPDLFKLGIYYILAGLFIKVVVADSVSQFVDFGFEDPTQLQFLNSWVTLYGFSVQILADFWGYSTIAVGVGYLFGYKLPINFNNPYIASSVGDFWRRWHVTLSTWLRDYLYFPLGGGRRKKYRNLFITLTLTGLWHGANWNFVLYGMCHGVWIVSERYYRDSLYAMKVPKLVKQILVFQGLAVLRVLFRAPDLAIAKIYFLSLLGAYYSDIDVSDTLIGLMFLFVGFLYFFERSLRDESFLKWTLPRQVLVSIFFITMILCYASARIDFIYFVF
jgi:D-alanyl-lipoteichoic acid acyltransferase DltB (MBOAT superfamily)